MPVNWMRQGAHLERSLTPLSQIEVMPLVLTIVALFCWWLALPSIDLRSMNNYGLASVLPPGYWLAIALMTLGFCLALARRPDGNSTLMVVLIAAILVLYGTPALIQEQPRFATTWTHIGFVEYISRTGRLIPELDARFSWPGFFVLAALINEVAGFNSAAVYAAWSPVIVNLLCLGPLWLLLNSLTLDSRIAWLSLWFFYFTNWVGQDYFSPQALNFFFFLTIIAILLHWFKATTRPGENDGWPWSWLARRVPVASLLDRWLELADTPNAPSTARQRVGLIGVVVTIFAAIVSSHQLTPFFALAVVTLLVGARRISARGLPLLMALMTAAWISYMTVVFLAGHVNELLGPLGRLGGNLGANVSGRIQGNNEHMVIVITRLGHALVLWGLALVGAIRRHRSGYRDLTVALMILAPFPLVAAQGYGGEMILRVYLFALPCTIFLVSTLFFESLAQPTSRRVVVMIGLITLILAVSVNVVRYGNERMDYISGRERAGVEYLYRVAPPGSYLLTASFSLPWRSQDIEQYAYDVQSPLFLRRDLDTIYKRLSDRHYPAHYLIITRSQQAHLELFEDAPPDWSARFIQQLRDSRRFRIVFDNGDALIAVPVGNG